ncbi:MAG: FAD-dependent oxidoreductase [Pseudomonadota bacterium]
MTQAEAGILPTPAGFDAEVETVIIGAGACGLVAALAAVQADQSVLVLERDAVPAGSTSLSAGLIPAAGTRFQGHAGIADSPGGFAADIMAKAAGEPDAAIVAALTEGAAPAIEWLADHHGLPFSLVDDFDYPGHGARRMHGLPTRSGAELIDALRAACERAGVDILCERTVADLFADAGQRVTGLRAVLPNGAGETVGCQRLILACNGFGGNAAKVSTHMPGIDEALYFGHAGNQGEALDWGRALGAATRHLGAYQGHGNVAHPHGILITWAVITGGGFQVNRDGARFWNEAQGYSEAARAVLAQPGGTVWSIFDNRIAAIARQFEDFRQAEAQNALLAAATLADLADQIGVSERALEASFASRQGRDSFGRDWSDTPDLQPPYLAVQVTGALFHTQGGLDIDATARVKRAEGGVLPNLFAAGGAACGVSGRGDTGYLSGNGLLSAVVLGRIAGSQGVAK